MTLLSVNKKIMDYIREQEPILTDFICIKLSCRISPADILEDIDYECSIYKFLMAMCRTTKSRGSRGKKTKKKNTTTFYPLSHRCLAHVY